MSYINDVTLAHTQDGEHVSRDRVIDSVVHTLVRTGGLRDLDTRDIDERVRKTMAVQRWRGLID